MKMITQTGAEKQDLFGKILRNAPFVFTVSNSEAYLLIRDLPAETEAYIERLIGKPEELRVLSEETERAVIRLCGLHEYEYSCHSQTIEYMHRDVRITYPRITNPKTSASISLIPWFMLVGRPYPVFLYLYAYWHYESEGRKSMELSAKAAGKMFGAPKFNKSTLCRSLKAMEDLFGVFGRALSIREPELPPTAEMIALIPEILGDCTPSEGIAQAFGVEPRQLPPPIRSTSALSQIPKELSAVIKAKAAPRTGAPDKRKRPKRGGSSKNKRVQRIIRYAEACVLEEFRRKFIAISRGLVLDAAAEFHRFLG